MRCLSVVFTAALLAAVTACSPTFDSACDDLCTTGARCMSPKPTDPAVRQCKRDCKERGVMTQQRVDDGELSQACYDAVVDYFDCVAGVTCTEFNADEVPAGCKEIDDRGERECNGTMTTTTSLSRAAVRTDSAASR